MIGAAGWSGSNSSRFDRVAPSSARTCSSDAPSAMRATPFNPKKPSRTFSGSRRIGRQSSVSGRGNAKPGGITPTISTRSRSISTTRPTTPGSAPNRLLHNPSPSTTTGAAPGRSSSVVNGRPRRGGVRSTSKNEAVTLAADTRCGLSGSVKLTATSLNPTTPSRVRLCSA